jgi:uncharacterized protein (UPF0335 family)
MPKAKPVGPESADTLSGQAQGRLKTIVQRIQRLMDDRAAVNDDIKEVFAEAKGEGFSTAILRKAIRIAAMDQGRRREEEALLDLYLGALDLL